MKKLTTEEFVKKAQQIHGDKYDYSETYYLGNKVKIKIICPKHGFFEQRPNNHIDKKTECPKCAQNNRQESNTKDNRYFENKLKKLGIQFIKILNNKNIELKCKYHGLYIQNIYNTMRGSKCPKCAENNRRINCKFVNTTIFIEKSKNIHNSKYSYNKCEFVNSKTKVKIICHEHGVFEQAPYSHMAGNGCPKCKSIISKPEIEVQDFVKSLGFKIQCNNRKILNGKELDIYIPSLNKAIEFNGTHWHYSKKHFVPGKHAIKSNLCKQKGIKLLHIREDLWLNKKEHMSNVIKKFLN